MTSLLDGIEADSATVFFTGREFTVPIQHTGGDSFCYFDKQWVEIDGDATGVSVHQPTAIIHKDMMPTLLIDDPVTIDGTIYIVRDMQFDRGQTGDVLLVLST